MALTLATVRSKVRAHIDEPSANYWTDAELNGYISDRQLDLWRKILQIRKDYFLSNFNLSLVANQFSYTVADGIPADIWRIETIRTTTSGKQNMVWNPGNPTSQAFIDGLNSDTPTFNPFQIYYALRNLTTLWVSPLPQSALTARVDYIQLPTAVSADSDTFLLPDPFLPYIQYMAASDALAKGPVGDGPAWESRADKAWNDIMLALDTPRSEQGPDVVEGAFADSF